MLSKTPRGFSVRFNRTFCDMREELVRALGRRGRGYEYLELACRLTPAWAIRNSAAPHRRNRSGQTLRNEDVTGGW